MCDRIHQSFHAVSQAMQELSDITSGLSELLQSSAQARAKEQEKEAAASKTDGAATNTPPSETSPLVPTDRNLLSSSEGMTSKIRRPYKNYNPCFPYFYAATLEESNPDTQVKVIMP